MCFIVFSVFEALDNRMHDRKFKSNASRVTSKIRQELETKYPQPHVNAKAHQKHIFTILCPRLGAE